MVGHNSAAHVVRGGEGDPHAPRASTASCRPPAHRVSRRWPDDGQADSAQQSAVNPAGLARWLGSTLTTGGDSTCRDRQSAGALSAFIETPTTSERGALQI